MRKTLFGSILRSLAEARGKQHHFRMSMLEEIEEIEEIEAAVEQLPTPEQEELMFFLTLRLQDRSGRVSNAPQARLSVLEISPVSVKKVLRPRPLDDDLLGEMLAGRM